MASDLRSRADGLVSSVEERGRYSPPLDLPAPEAAGSLDLHKGIPDPLASGCLRWPEDLRLLNHSTGELVPGRCRATNLCRYCQTLYVVETVEMLTLDAIEYAPTIWVVLTAREHLTRAACTDHLTQLRRAARKRWPAIEWFVQVEFQRRGALHLNLLIKGVPIDQVDELQSLLVERWCERVDAEPVGQWSGAIADGEGVVKYLSKMLAHGLKAEQRPPIGWRGHRTSQTRGYLVRPASVMRVEARQALKLKRKLWRGLSLEVAEHELQEDAKVEWSLQRVSVGLRLHAPPTKSSDVVGVQQRAACYRVEPPCPLIHGPSVVAPASGLSGESTGQTRPKGTTSSAPVGNAVSTDAPAHRRVRGDHQGSPARGSLACEGGRRRPEVPPNPVQEGVLLPSAVPSVTCTGLLWVRFWP